MGLFAAVILTAEMAFALYLTAVFVSDSFAYCYSNSAELIELQMGKSLAIYINCQLDHVL